MLVAVYASLLLASVAQDPSATPDAAAPEATQEQSVDIYTEEPAGTHNGNGDGTQEDYPTEQPLDSAEPAEDPAPAQTAETQEPEPEPEQPMVCRRQMTFDAFNRQRSRKVCRPRDEW
ncbi:MAG: hypothetical protein M3177_10785 [Pseudomonadota bacterium]|nr:hypothetical protein [Pseudomonadota bacterium]